MAVRPRVVQESVWLKGTFGPSGVLGRWGFERRCLFCSCRFRHCFVCDLQFQQPQCDSCSSSVSVLPTEHPFCIGSYSLPRRSDARRMEAQKLRARQLAFQRVCAPSLELVASAWWLGNRVSKSISKQMWCQLGTILSRSRARTSLH